MFYCVHCGEKQYNKAKYCHLCGKPHPKPDQLGAEGEAAVASYLEDVEPEQIVRRAIRRRSPKEPSDGSYGSVIVAVMVIIV